MPSPFPGIDPYLEAPAYWSDLVYSWMLRDPLPTLPVPLRAPDRDLLIDLAAVFNTAYDRGRFGRRIDHKGPAPSQLNADESKWANTLLG